MYRIKFVPRVLLILAWLSAAPLHAALSNSPGEGVLPQPGIDLLPQDVVRIVINALANNDRPFTDAGIATTFAFASPANKVNTGPLQKFAQMIRTPAYGIMIDHVDHEFSEVVLMGNQAYEMVKINDSSGTEVIFAFRLSQQQGGEFDEMWMTDAVWPVATGDIPEQAF
jgi:hypothetical protein